ncbi:hypothetical protein JCM5296_005910 [Sporobolomyces johnsonii]
MPASNKNKNNGRDQRATNRAKAHSSQRVACLRNCPICFEANIKGSVAPSTRSAHTHKVAERKGLPPLRKATRAKASTSTAPPPLPPHPPAPAASTSPDPPSDFEREFGGGEPVVNLRESWDRWWEDPPDEDRSEGEEEDGEVTMQAEVEDAGEDVELSEKAAFEQALERLGSFHVSEVEAEIARIPFSQSDFEAFRALSLNLSGSFTRRGWEFFRRLYPEFKIDSEYVALRRLRKFSAVEPEVFSMCVNSCAAFTGDFAALVECPICAAPRFENDGCTPRATYDYLSPRPVLRKMQLDKDLAQQLRYRANHQGGEDLEDIFDGENYRSLLGSRVSIRPAEQWAEAKEYPHKYFDGETDVALTVDLDGFAPFNRRQATCWPVMAVNLNLPPSVRTRQEHLIPLLVMPGPKKPSHFDSFLWPLYEDLKELGTDGHWVQDGVTGLPTVQRVYVLAFCGDTPALAQLMRFMGHSARLPCRHCKIDGIYNGTRYYHPLSLPRNFPSSAKHPSRPSHSATDPSTTLARSDTSVRQDVSNIAAANNKKQARQACGINSLTRASELPGIDLSRSFALDFMHAIFENLVKNLIKLWIGSHNQTPPGATFVLDSRTWRTIGDEITHSAQLIPSRFGHRMPNPATNLSDFTAEDYSNFLLLIGPVVLFDRLPSVYYEHFLALRRIVRAFLAFQIRRADVEQGGSLRREVEGWVEEYERIYYEYDYDRLPLTPYSVHCILHIPDYALFLGPPPMTWCFVEERYCHALGRLISSRLHPYRSLQNGILAQYRLRVATLGRPELRTILNPPPPPPRYRPHITDTFHLKGPSKPITLSSHQRQNLAGHLALRLNKARSTILKRCPTTATAWAQVAFDQGRDVVESAGLQVGSRATLYRRDATHLLYDTQVDINARYRTREPVFTTKTYFGRCDYLWTVTYDDTTYELALVTRCKTSDINPTSLDTLTSFSTTPASGYGATYIIDVRTIRGCAARIERDGKYWVVERSMDEARPIFAEDEDALN